MPAGRRHERTGEERERPLHQATARDEHEPGEREGHRDVEPAHDEQARAEELEEPRDDVEARGRVDGVDVAVEDLAAATRRAALARCPSSMSPTPSRNRTS